MIFIVPHDEELPPEATEMAGEALTRADLFAELSEALSLPEYFGNNWDAFEECLGDREVPDLVVHNARALWERMPRDMMLLVDVWLDRAPDARLILVW